MVKLVLQAGVKPDVQVVVKTGATIWCQNWYKNLVSNSGVKLWFPIDLFLLLPEVDRPLPAPLSSTALVSKGSHPSKNTGIL